MEENIDIDVSNEEFIKPLALDAATVMRYKDAHAPNSVLASSFRAGSS